MWLVAAFAQAHFNNGKLFMVLLFMVTVSVSVFFFCELTFCLYLGCKLRECFIHLKDHRETEPLRNIPAIITFCEGALKTSWKLFVNIFSVTIIRLQRRLRRRKIVTLHYDKNRQSFCDVIRLCLCSTFP